MAKEKNSFFPVSICTALKQETYDEITRIARDEDRTISAQMRRILVAGLDARRSKLAGNAHPEEKKKD